MVAARRTLPLPLRPHYLCVTEYAAHVEIVPRTWRERLLSRTPWRATREHRKPRVMCAKTRDRIVWLVHPDLAPEPFGDMRGTIEITAALADQLAAVMRLHS